MRPNFPENGRSIATPGVLRQGLCQPAGASGSPPLGTLAVPSLLRTLLYNESLRPLVCDVSGHSERADRAVRTLLYDAAHSQLRLEDGSITSTHYEACLNFDGAF